MTDAVRSAGATGSTVAAHLAEIEDHGYTVIPDVFDQDWAGHVVATLDRLEHDLGVVPAGNSFEGASTWRIYNLLARGPLFRGIPVHPRVLPVVEGVLDEGCLISSLSSIVIGPGERSQPIHADDQVMPLAKPHVATVCNTMWALTDFTEANGATRVVPVRTAPTTPPPTVGPTTRSPPRCPWAASWCGTGPCGTGVAPTAPTGDATASR